MSADGIPFFKHYILPFDELKLIENMYGIAGYGVIYKLYERIFSYGYFCVWNAKICRVFALNDCRLKCELVAKIVASCIDEGVFDKRLYDKYSILTSADIQERFYTAAKRRGGFRFKEEYRLIETYDGGDIFAGYANSQSKLDFIASHKELKPWLEYFDVRLIIYAFRICERQNKKSFSYLTGILQNWKKRGVMYLDDINEPLSDEELELIDTHI